MSYAVVSTPSAWPRTLRPRTRAEWPALPVSSSMDDVTRGHTTSTRSLQPCGQRRGAHGSVGRPVLRRSPSSSAASVTRQQPADPVRMRPQTAARSVVEHDVAAVPVHLVRARARRLDREDAIGGACVTSVGTSNLRRRPLESACCISAVLTAPASPASTSPRLSPGQTTPSSRSSASESPRRPPRPPGALVALL